MYVDVQRNLPGVPETAVSAVLSLLATHDGPASVHWKITSVPTGDLLAEGAALRKTNQDAGRIATDVLTELLRELPILVDPPPFP